MAQTERVEILDIGTKTLKELRAELKELKAQLEGLVIGSEDYNKTLQDISNAQKQLSSVTKSSVADMEGSYNALNKELNDLRKAWKATNDEAERTTLSERMNDINSQLKELDASVGNYQRNVGNYGSAFDELDGKIQATSQSFDSAITSSNKFVESGDNLEKITMSMVSAMGLAKIGMEAFGIQGEEAEKIMQKLQTVLAVSSGFKVISEGARGFLQLSKTIKIATIATNGFKAAMISTGIGAVVAALGLLIVNWDKISAKWKDTSSQDIAIDKLQELERAIASINRETERSIAIGKEQGITELEILKIRRDAAIKAQQEATAAVAARQKELYTVGGLKRTDLSEEDISRINDDIKQLTDQRNQLQKNIDDLNAEIATTIEVSKLQSQKMIKELIIEGKDGLVRINAEFDAEIVAFKKRVEEKIATQEEFVQYEALINEKRAKAIQDYNNSIKENVNEVVAVETVDLSKYYALTKSELDTIEDSYKEEIKIFQEYLDKKYITQEQFDIAAFTLMKNRDEEIKNYNKNQVSETINTLYQEYQIQADAATREFNSKMVDLTIAGDESGMRELNESFIQSQIDSLNKLKETLSGYGEYAKDIVYTINGQISDLENDKKLAKNEDKIAIEKERTESLIELSDIMIQTADRVNTAWSKVFGSIEEGFFKMSKEMKSSEKGWNKYGKVAGIGIGIASDMLGGLAEMQDTTTKEGFEKNKKLQIASATMAMLSGIVNTWLSVMSKENSWMGIWGQVATGTALSAMLTATGLAQINQIKSTTFDGGNGSASSPTINALSAMTVPVETVTQIQGASVEEDVRDQRVYVLESDIHNTSKKVNVVQSEATF